MCQFLNMHRVQGKLVNVSVQPHQLSGSARYQFVPNPSMQTSMNTLVSSRPLGQTLPVEAFEGWTALERLRGAYPFTCRHMTDAAKAHAKKMTSTRKECDRPEAQVFHVECPM